MLGMRLDYDTVLEFSLPKNEAVADMRILFDYMLERKRIGLIATRDEGANWARFNRNAAYLLAIRENDLIVRTAMDSEQARVARVLFHEIAGRIRLPPIHLSVEYADGPRRRVLSRIQRLWVWRGFVEEVADAR